jgi:membrane-bound inhibitor of C-type lysozyme
MPRPGRRKDKLPPPNAAPIDRDGLHRLLWNRSGRLQKVTLRYADLADQLGLNYYTVAKVMASFVAEGRLFVISKPKSKSGTVYRVVDPDVWEAQRAGGPGRT